MGRCSSCESQPQNEADFLSQAVLDKEASPQGNAEEEGICITVCPQLSLLRGRKSGLSQLCLFIHPKYVNQRSHLPLQINSEYNEWDSEIPGECVRKLPLYGNPK